MKFKIDHNQKLVTPELSGFAVGLRERLTVPGYLEPVDFIKLPVDSDILSAVSQIARAKNPGGVKWVILIGIGGSSLGAAAVYQPLKNLDDNLAELTVVDTVDPIAVGAVLDRLKTTTLTAEELAVVVVSKSGDTVEVIANAAVLFDCLANRFGEVATDRVVIISNENSPLWQLAIDKKIATIAIPKVVGGRFSLFSPAGLLPLALCGLPISELCAGAAAVIETNVDVIGSAATSAIMIAEHNRAGKNILDFFVFSPELFGVGQWYRQLIAESLGKDGKGLTPTVSIGSTDLHSQAQLVLGGPKDKITIAVGVALGANDPVVPSNSFSTTIPGLAGRSLGAVMAAIYQGAIGAYQQAGVPLIEIELEALSAREIGALMQTLLFQVLYLAELSGVEPFGQPAVESYKAKTRHILST